MPVHFRPFKGKMYASVQTHRYLYGSYEQDWNGGKVLQLTKEDINASGKIHISLLHPFWHRFSISVVSKFMYNPIEEHLDVVLDY